MMNEDATRIGARRVHDQSEGLLVNRIDFGVDSKSVAHEVRIATRFPLPHQKRSWHLPTQGLRDGRRELISTDPSVPGRGVGATGEFLEFSSLGGRYRAGADVHEENDTDSTRALVALLTAFKLGAQSSGAHRC